MDLDSIPDAAKLAARAPAGGVLPPTDDGLDVALLDLWADRPEVARNKLVAVARAFGPRLQIQDGFQLLVHSGSLAPSYAAAILAEAAFADAPGPLIAVLRGEDVVEQLETFIAAGCQFEHHLGAWPITAEKRTIARAWAAAPRSVWESLQEDAARVIISRHADEATLGGGAEKPGDHGLISVELIEGYELHTTTRHAGMLEGLPSELTAAMTSFTDPKTGAVQVTLAAERYDRLRELASRFELAAGTGAFDRPLADQITPRFSGAWIRPPRGLLEFGVEARPARDWVL